MPILKTFPLKLKHYFSITCLWLLISLYWIFFFFFLQTVDYESQRAYKIKVKGINRHIEKRFLEKDTKFEDETILRIIVKDADEPPAFVSEEFFMEVAEDNWNGSFVGTVSARDPDDIDSPIRYTPNLKICPGHIL